MRKSKKLQHLVQRKERTLSVCFPHVIKDKKDVESLFVGDFHVRLPRQTSRSCHVVFSSVEEKIKNQKLVKNNTVNGKHIIVKPLKDIIITQKKKTNKKQAKKLYVPTIRPDIKVTQGLFVANIVIGVKADEVKGAISGCVSVTLLKPYNDHFRSAIAKMESIPVAAEYLSNQHKWPILRGHKLSLKTDTRTKHKKKVSTGSIKIYDGSTEESVKKEDEPNEKHESSDCRGSSDESS